MFNVIIIKLNKYILFAKFYLTKIPIQIIKFAVEINKQTKQFMKKIIIATGLLLMTLSTQAQVKTPQASPKADVHQVVAC